jgi:hypothetical protein
MVDETLQFNPPATRIQWLGAQPKRVALLGLGVKGIGRSFFFWKNDTPAIGSLCGGKL